ncbi:uncharacterized protein CDAR_553201 [Caerostris darwini]|uniref:Uncharacterized protein n=1 Tax=Caerostris darwini TaxID=1538125 RepID=A0AAV4WZF9_9ARAC|nr:uncharacterized protein CDAR_553201 [Caerostris darwini]
MKQTKPNQTSTGTTVSKIKLFESDPKLKVSGSNDGSKHNILPNTDSLWYFIKPGLFWQYHISPESIGILGYLLRTKSVTSTLCTKESLLLNVKFEIIEEIEKKFGDLSFYMWRPIALDIARIILEEEETYEYWSDERIMIHLEEGIFPDLEGEEAFEVHEAIADMVLIQGKVHDPETDVEYIGPAYIPRSVRNLTLVDDPSNRPRIVMILLREEKYHSQTIMGWIKPQDISYKGLCLVHGIKRASMYGVEQMQETLAAHRTSFIQTLGQFFRRSEERILHSSAP